MAPDACAAGSADPSKGVFVTPKGTGTTCSVQSPCGAIQVAITAARQQQKATVYIGAGAYVEQLSIAHPVTLQGGWREQGGVWSRDCSAARANGVVIEAPGAANKTVVVSLSGMAVLDSLTIASRKTAAKPGESIYGIVAIGGLTRLELLDVEVRASAGGEGVAGAAGVAGYTGASACALTQAQTGANGDPGAPGAAAIAGSMSEGGYVPGNGATGTAGAAGKHGEKLTADAPECLRGIVGCATIAGTYRCSNEAEVTSCGSKGTVGCGGGGGAPGAGGSGGGSSVALFAWRANVDVVGGSLAAGDGGRGGNGGARGPSGAPGTGAAGTAGEAIVTTCTYPPPLNVCANVVGARPAGASAGGRGGLGGLGGEGGGGAGGPSYGFYKGGSAAVVTSGTRLAHGAGGAGGNGGNPGPTGDAANSN